MLRSRQARQIDRSSRLVSLFYQARPVGADRRQETLHRFAQRNVNAAGLLPFCRVLVSNTTEKAPPNNIAGAL